MKISEGEAATSAAAEFGQPEIIQIEELIRLEPETPSYSASLRGTPLRESARAAKLLITKSKSKSKHEEEETFSKEGRKAEKKTAEFSKTVSSLSESEEGLKVDQLLKKEKAKKQNHQRKTTTSMSTSATSVAYTSSKSSKVCISFKDN